jgi:carboxyl-terminal processing protease
MNLNRRQSDRQQAERWLGLTPQWWTYVRLGSAFLLILLVGLILGILVERRIWTDRVGPAGAFADFDAVVDIVEDDYYYRPTDDSTVDEFTTRMEQDAIAGLLSGLGDDYTTYLAPPDATRASNQLEGKAVGIGADFFAFNNQAVIARVYPGTPAEGAGLRTGDAVLRINGEPVDTGNWPEFLSRIEGEVGSEVRLTLQRPDQASTFDVDLERTEYNVPSVYARMIDNSSIGWVQIGIFGSKTTDEFDAALSSLTAAGATGIILDLRGNGGGWVTAAQSVLGRLLDPAIGPALYEDETPGRGDEKAFPIIGGGTSYFDLPVIVLTDGNTASAAEIVAGALRDYDRAMVVGEQTFGKGSVQRVYEFRTGASLRVTFAEWLTPSKGRIQEEGIKPDVQVPAANPEDIIGKGDPVVKTAVRLLEEGTSKPSDLAQLPPAATPAA